MFRASMGRFAVILFWALFLLSPICHALPEVGTTLTRSGNTTLILTFTSAATASDANTATNYTLSGTGGLSGNPTSAALDTSGTSVTLTVPTMASLTHGASVIVTVASTVASPTGNLIATYTVDAVPGAFSFTAIDNALTSTTYESSAISITDINTTLTLATTSGSNTTLTCAKYAGGGTSWSAFATCSSLTVSAGDLVKLKLTSASTYSTLVSGGITVGGISATFSVTTFSAAAAAPIPIPSNVSISTVSSLTSVLDSPPNGLYISSNGVVVVPATVSAPLTLLPAAAEETAFWIQSGGTTTFVLAGRSISIAPSESMLALLKYYAIDDYEDLPVLEIIKGQAAVSANRDIAPIASLLLGTGSSTKQLAVLPDGDATLIANVKMNSDGTGVIALTSGIAKLRAASSASTIVVADTPTSLFTHEVATLASTGTVSAIRIGSADNNGTVVGDPMSFTTSSLLYSDIDRQAKIPRLGSTVARLGGSDTLLEILFDTIGLRSNLARGGQTSQGAIPLLIDGIAYYFAPIGNVTVDAARANGVVLTTDGFFEIASGGVLARFKPSIFDTQGFATSMASTMGATVALNSGGALVISQNGNTLIMMPEMFAQAVAGASNGVAYDPSGILQYTKNSQTQRLLPVFYDQQQLAAAFSSLADSIRLQDNMDGTVTATLVETVTEGEAEVEITTVYVLSPDYRILSPLIVSNTHRDDAWWIGDDGLIYIKYSNGSAQGFGIR